jgi:ABC-2 type transport system permease protein
VADGSDAMVGTLGLGYAVGVLGAERARSDRTPSLELKPKVLYNPDMVSRFFMVPGVLAMILMVMTMTLSSMAIVREREIGTMEQLLVTPLAPSHIIAGKLVPYALVGAVEMLSALPVVLLWFRVPLRGSFLTLAVLAVPFVLCMLGLGLLVSTLARTQQQAMMIATFLFMMPQIYLSGFIFPIQNMPRVFQWATYAIPLRYFVTSLRGVFLKGVGLDILWPQGLAMLGLAAVILGLARLRFRRRLG